VATTSIETFAKQLLGRFCPVKKRCGHNDRYAVAVKKDEMIIGQLPRKISHVCSLFLRRGGCTSCTVTGTKRYSADLPQGGLEIPCLLLL